jgi:uncharacterized membrane protein
MKGLGIALVVVGGIWMLWLEAMFLGVGWVVASFLIPPLILAAPFVILSKYGVFPWMPVLLEVAGFALAVIGIARTEKTPTW